MILASEFNRPCRQVRRADDRSGRRVAPQLLWCRPTEVDPPVAAPSRAAACAIRSSAASSRSAAASGSSVSLAIAPAPPHVPHELKAGAALNVKQISCQARRGRAVVVITAWRMPARCSPSAGRSRCSPPRARRCTPAAAGGVPWSSALAPNIPDIPIDDILDCADAPGLALGALRIGQRRIVLDPAAPGWSSVAAIATSLGGEVLTSRPPSHRYGRPVSRSPATRLVAGANHPG